MAGTIPKMQNLSHEDLGPQLNAIAVGLVLLSALFLFMRVYLKLSQRRGLWWDDYILILAWVTLFIIAVLNYLTVLAGYGKHVYDIEFKNFGALVTYGGVAGTLTILASAWSKTSFALTLLRLPIGWMKWIVWFVIISINMLLYLSAISLWLECRPTPPGQKNPPQQPLCIPVDLALWYGIFAGGYSAVMDLTLACLPWKILWNLQMKRAEKAGVLIAMSMGVFAGMAAAVKTAKLNLLASPDLTFDGVSLACWGMAEIAVTIMAACIPILRALFGRTNKGMPLGSVNRDTAFTEKRKPSVRKFPGSDVRTIQWGMESNEGRKQTDHNI